MQRNVTITLLNYSLSSEGNSYHKLTAMPYTFIHLTTQQNIYNIKLEPLLTIIELSPRGPHMIPEGFTKQNTSKPRKTAKFKGPDEVRDTEE